MNPNESAGTQSSERSSHDVETLLKQMALRGPSEQLDAVVTRILAAKVAVQDTADDVNEYPVASRGRFGWTGLLVTAAAAMLAGVLLGYVCLQASVPDLAVAAAASPSAESLTPVSFNVRAFNLLHGHSERSEFKNCDRCHQQSEPESSALGKIFQGWFYGDEHFFQAHADGLADCSQCHVIADAGQDDQRQDLHREFGKLANCSQCHQVGVDGFDGFENDWRSVANRFEG